MADTNFDAWVAQRYERLWPELFDPEVVDPTVDFLASLAGVGPALEFGIGTGGIALPLSRRGVRVHGIELSSAMAEQLQTKQGVAAIGVSIGDFATTRVDGVFTLVYLLRNTITNLTTQAEQVECFRNAAKHLEEGGFFVIENYVPNVRQLPAGELTYVFTSTPDHVGIEEYDLAAQIAVSRHWWVIDGGLKTFSSPHRTCGRPSLTSWPASRAWCWSTATPTGIVSRSPATVGITSRSGRRRRHDRARTEASPEHPQNPSSNHQPLMVVDWRRSARP